MNTYETCFRNHEERNNNFNESNYSKNVKCRVSRCSMFIGHRTTKLENGVGTSARDEGGWRIPVIAKEYHEQSSDGIHGVEETRSESDSYATPRGKYFLEIACPSRRHREKHGVNI